MKKQYIFLNDWLDIHPYVSALPSDFYFVKLANRLFGELDEHVPEDVRIDIGLFVAAYLEDVISGLGLWNAFVEELRRLYGRNLPFYDTDESYE